MFTIKRAAGMTGVPETTLRAWERRYGVIRPERTEGGYRVYDDAALDRIRLMRDLVAQGWAPRQAADRVAGTSAPGTGSVPGTAEFLGAAADLDTTRLAAVLEQAMSAVSFEVFVETWLMPALTDLGVAWSRGEVSVGGEHLAANAVLRRLAAVFDESGRHSSGQQVLVGLPAGAHHELGAFAFATMLRRRGVDVLYGGADLPVGDWVDVARRHQVVGTVLSVPMTQDVSPTQDTVDALAGAVPGLVIAVGGRCQDEVARAERLGQPISSAVDRLVTLLSHGHGHGHGHGAATSRANTTTLST